MAAAIIVGSLPLNPNCIARARPFAGQRTMSAAELIGTEKFLV